MFKHLLTLMLLAILMPAISQELYRMPKNVRSSVSSLENINGVKGQGGMTNAGAKGSAFCKVKAGESKTLLDISTPGIIKRMWFTIDDRSPKMLRSLHLRIYWDHAETPAVDVPFGDFFGAGVGKIIPFESNLFSSPEGRSFNCFVPMPFAKAARITLTNESDKDLPLLFFDIDFLQYDHPEKDLLYFHSIWNRPADTTLGKDLELLPKITGKGRFLGASVGVNVNPDYGKTWWGEGEVKMYIDGDDKNPSINGTGAEDYIGTGWFEGVFSHAYQGCLVADEKKGQYSFYKFHIPDEIWFYKDCRVTLQQIGGWFAPQVKILQSAGIQLEPVSLYNARKGFRGLKEANTPKNELDQAAEDDWLNFYRIDDYAITSYFYLDTPNGTQPALMPVQNRIKSAY